MNVRDAVSAGHMRSIETTEDQPKKTFFHPKANEEVRNLFEKKFSVYELMCIPLIYIDERGFAEDMPRTFGYSYRRDFLPE